MTLDVWPCTEHFSPVTILSQKPFGYQGLFNVAAFHTVDCLKKKKRIETFQRLWSSNYTIGIVEGEEGQGVKHLQASRHLINMDDCF